jgi:hypothetical protein
VRPVHGPEAAVFHAARAADVVLTVVKGRVLFRDGVLATLDEAAISAAVDEAAARVRAALVG